MRETDKTLIFDQLGHLFEEELLDKMVAHGKAMHFPKDELVIDIGVPINAMPLVLKGAIKVLREDEQGNELLLYYLEGGDTCTMSMSCCLERKKSQVRAITEDDSVIAFIHTDVVTKWISEFPKWRSYIFSSFQIRVDELLGAVDMLAFLKMDQRVFRYLEKLGEIQNSATVKTTHRQIAEDLNTSRVVVSRVLKDLENRSLLKINRNSIDLFGWSE